MNGRLFFLLFFIFLLFVVNGCSKTIIMAPVPSPAIQPPTPAKKTPSVVSKKTDRKERPYAVNGKWYSPIASVNEFKEKGICSWYGPDFHGKPTSSGELYDMFGFTAAHRILPFNTQVRVRNPSNKKEIVVRINDRGPFLKDRILDLSYSGAKELGVIGSGTALIELEALGILEDIEENGRKFTRLVKQVDFQQGEFSVQIGAFKDRQNALSLKERLQKEYPTIEISETIHSGETLFRVRVTQYKELKEAVRLQNQLEEKGFSQALVVAD
ncbi:MAG: septal ring lytic transglycosylase RlpA family protein [Thermodesulfobacteriota bacterium]|jgi:rare lipoprotein A